MLRNLFFVVSGALLLIIWGGCGESSTNGEGPSLSSSSLDPFAWLSSSSSQAALFPSSSSLDPFAWLSSSSSLLVTPSSSSSLDPFAWLSSSSSLLVTPSSSSSLDPFAWLSSSSSLLVTPSSSSSLEESSSSVADLPGRLANIHKTCTNMPAKITGGTNGWSSRYWDCCKPHCAWLDHSNGKTVTKNCNIKNEEIACYWQNGYTVDGCQGGESYVCYNQAPYAVCDNLAYGLAAVSASKGSEVVCGRCYQLDFDGGAHNKTNDAPALMAGKTMIVMASNVGYDVEYDQFDIMIPGGGLGAFQNGCALQWGVNKDDASLVGETYGGFTSTCLKSLGYKAPASSVKECVRGMCDKLFGGKQELHDLWEGCVWYVEWMHAVDNPTFKYTEVACPQELQDLYFSNFH